MRIRGADTRTAESMINQALTADERAIDAAQSRAGGLFPKHTDRTTERERKHCATGFLMALEWLATLDEPPSVEYKQALAEMYGIEVPVMNRGENR